MHIFGLQKLAMVDYPGKLAATVFTGGCNLRCPFCHNALLVTRLAESNELDPGEVLAFLASRRGLLDGVVLSGGVQVVQQDYYGNRSVLSVLQPGDTFGEVFACAGLTTLPVSVLAAKDSRLLLLDCRRMITLCPNTCGFHSRLIQNLLQLMARKNLEFTRKIRTMSQKTTRDKLLSYLLSQAKAQGASQFVIPLDRQALADYLGVERSAMSAEISKLKKAGVLDTKGSWFSLMEGHT